MKKNIVGWEVFYIADLYDIGNTKFTSRFHPSRAKARDQMRRLKAQPWTFRSVFMCRVVNDNMGRVIWEKAR